MVETKLVKQKPIDIDVARFKTLSGGVVIHGVHLISNKLIGVINEIMKLDEYTDKDGVKHKSDNFGVRNITFKNDGYPTGKVGMAYVDAGAIAINLEEIWSSCLSVLEEGKVKLSMTGIIWHELIKTVLHEIHHIDACRDPELRKLIEDDPKGADEEAENWASEIIVDLTKTFDIEPSALSEMPFFRVKLMELMTTMNDEDWVTRTKLMLEEGIMYHDEDNNITLTSFKEYIRGIDDPENKDDSYEQGVSVIDLIFNMDDGSSIKTAEATSEPKTEEVTKPTAETEASKEVETTTATNTTSPGETLFGQIPTEEDHNTPMNDNTIDKVQLPEHIVAEQEQIAAAASAVPATSPPATQYTPNGLSSETIVAFLKDVYMRLYTQIFTKCGWQLNSDQCFTNPGAILEPVSIVDLIQLHQAPNLIMEYDTLDGSGHLKPEECKGFIRGLVFNKSNQYGIPAFAIYLNLNGMRVKRSLIAQNAAKITNGSYSPMALEARAGHAIAWLFSEDENKKFVAKIRDNVYEAL